MAKPWEYYENNIAGTLTLVDVMRKHNVKNIIFSSSAQYTATLQSFRSQRSVRRVSVQIRMAGQKSMLEQILTDIQKADPEWNVVLLRY